MKKRLLMIALSLTFYSFAFSDESQQILNKKVVLIGVGLAGAGKTTTLEKLSKSVANSIFFDKDVVNQSLLGDNAYFSDYYYKHIRNQTYQVLLDLAELNAKRRNCLVILDGQFGDKLHKEPFASLLKKRDFEVKVVYFNCSEETNKERLIARGESRDEEKLQNFDAFYHPTTALHEQAVKNLPHLTINTEKSIDENVSKILEDLNAIP